MAARILAAVDVNARSEALEEPMSMTVEEALAWPKMDEGARRNAWYADSLAQGFSRWSFLSWEDAQTRNCLDVLAAEVRRLQAEQGGPCTTCQHTYSSAIGEPTCAKLRRACVYMAGGCRAWKAKP